MSMKSSKLGLDGQKASSKKTQGSKAPKAAKSDKGQKAEPQKDGRGMGSEFAYAVKEVLDDARNMRGSTNSFLGVDKKVLDPKQYTDSQHLMPLKK